MTGIDHLDVVGAQSVLEVAEVVAAALGARMELGGEPGRIVVTGAPDPALRVVIELAIHDRGLPERWTRASRSPTTAVATNAAAGPSTSTAPSPNAATGHSPRHDDRVQMAPARAASPRCYQTVWR
ncbi:MULTISPECIES: hypothetical protein [unclassified Rhodococcus (in: high G+C Gram-positive bacteria)]|uniref:hypothetical protein n=1 Tax=unclassified Rhodococcus (in: high G+C Gram-positive bacteria) TaxID=192944 RepID=UPI001ED8EC8B|nr:hypothetical protein [Rhodococcus sp. DK17]